MHCFLFTFTLALNSVLLFWTLPVLEFLLGVSANFCVPNVCHSSNNFASARCASVATFCRDADVFETKTVS
jgi:hypothetical protein